MSDIRARATRFAVRALHHRPLSRIASAVAGFRRRSLVLVYHRIAPDGPAPYEVVPSTSVALFVEQLRALARIGDIVPLDTVLDPVLNTGLHTAPDTPHTGRRPRFAITFDDDHPSHCRWTLPILQELGVHATFFLSGRVLHGLGAYWWCVLEHSVKLHGLAFTQRALGVDGASALDIAMRIQGTPLTNRLHDLLPAPPVEDGPPMTADDVRTLAAAGMGLGFHTLHHPMLTTLTPEAVEVALADGRRELEALAGRPLDLLAYPHGAADEHIAAAARRHGFRAALTTKGRATTADSDTHLIGRWDPGLTSDDEFLAWIAMRVSLSAA